MALASSSVATQNRTAASRLAGHHSGEFGVWQFSERRGRQLCPDEDQMQWARNPHLAMAIEAPRRLIEQEMRKVIRHNVVRQ
jgi:hypothetical protein